LTTIQEKSKHRQAQCLKGIAVFSRF